MKQAAGECDFPLARTWDRALLTQTTLRFHDWNMNAIQREYPKRQAFATLITNSARKNARDNTLGYLEQAIALGGQLRSMYKNMELLALVVNGQLERSDASRLEAAGYAVLWRDAIHPFGEPTDGVYHDQHMKLWLWNETDYARIAYIDSDTFFLGRVNFAEELERPDAMIACPTPWSLSTPLGRPLSLNGGFFILTPSADMFARLISGASGTPTHFSKHYPHFGWLDETEMGVLMREFPDFAYPRNISAFCGEERFCCEPGALSLPYCSPRPYIPTPVTKSVMVHGFKPSGIAREGEPLSALFEPQSRLRVPGYDNECLLREFIRPLSELMAEHAIKAR